jgi:hypothetical protein
VHSATRLEKSSDSLPSIPRMHGFPSPSLTHSGLNPALSLAVQGSPAMTLVRRRCSSSSCPPCYRPLPRGLLLSIASVLVRVPRTMLALPCHRPCRVRTCGALWLHAGRGQGGSALTRSGAAWSLGLACQRLGWAQAGSSAV